jgi:DNA-binding MarR family transcriptional regulator
MSTRFTSRGIPLVESQSLQVIQSASKLNDVITTYLSKGLIKKGYSTLTPSLLSFLSILECGVNYGSEIARNIGVTRQMVAKTVKELCRLGYLEQKDSTGKQKEIRFTETGEYLMSDARQLLSEVDEIIFKNLDVRKPNIIISELNTISNAINEKLQT